LIFYFVCISHLGQIGGKLVQFQTLALSLHLEDLLKSVYSRLMIIAAGLSLAACAPSASQLKKVMEDNPDIMFSVIEKNPDKFLKVVNEAAQKARQVEEEHYKEDENKKREEEFKNPKAPDIAGERTFKGAKDAKITIVEYSDFQCPFCRRGFQTVDQVIKAYPNQVKVIFKDFPIERIHPHALKASQYYEAIGMQDRDKANKFHDLVFENQTEFTDKGETYLKEAAKKVGANVAKVQKDINSETVKKILDADKAEAEKFGFSGTPGYLINGVSLKGAYPFEDFKSIIDRQLGGGAAPAAPAPDAKKGA
jgi:protein-disulfide isomerase